MVLIITIVHTTNVSAKSYTADDNYVMDTKYHDLFRNYFGKDVSFKYFPYRCDYNNYTRECYYGIDSENNYVNIIYQDYGSYNYNQIIDFGKDENFSVTGNNIYEVNVDNSEVIKYILIFAIVFIVIWLMLGAM